MHMARECFPRRGDISGSLQEWGGGEANTVGDHRWRRIGIVGVIAPQGAGL